MQTKLLKSRFLTPCPSPLTLRDTHCCRQAASFPAVTQRSENSRRIREKKMSTWELLNVCMCGRPDLLKDRAKGTFAFSPFSGSFITSKLLSPAFSTAFRYLHGLMSFLFRPTPAPLHSIVPAFLGVGAFLDPV